MIRAEDTLVGAVRRIPVDMVVLAVALEPQADAEEVRRLFNFSCGAEGFFTERHPKLAPVSTFADGVFLAGACQGPKDIPDSVAQAGAAAAEALVLIDRGSVELEPSTAFVDAANARGAARASACARSRRWPSTPRRRSRWSTRCSARAAVCASPPARRAPCSNTCSPTSRSWPRSKGCSIVSETITFEPRIVAFFCTWCTYTAADLAGISRMEYAPNVRVMRLMCSGRVDPQFVLAAFRHGADGVLIGGCHPGDCHYEEGNYRPAAVSSCCAPCCANGGRGRAAAPGVDLGLRGRPGAAGLQRDDRGAAPARAAAPERPQRPAAELAGEVRSRSRKVAFYWCASCGGCEEAVVDLGEDLLAVAEPSTSSSGRSRSTSSARTSRRSPTASSRRRSSTARSGPPSRRRWPSCCAASPPRWSRSAAAPARRHPRPREPVRARGDPRRRLPRGAEPRERRGDDARAGEPRRRGDAQPAGVLRLRAHARPGDRRRLLPARLRAADGSDRRGGDGARRGEAAGEGRRARARRGAVLRVPAGREQAGEAPGGRVQAAARDAHRPGPLPARPGPHLPRPGDPRGLRRRLHRREHALHWLHGPDEPRRRPRREGAVGDRVADRRERRGRDRRARRRDPRPGRHLLPLRPAGLAAAQARAAGDQAKRKRWRR